MSNQLEPWLQFLKRKENIGLPIMEAKQKYLKEQLEFDNFTNQQNSILQGKANKIKLASNPPPPPFVGPERYKNFGLNTCYYPSIEADIYDFGPDNILTDLPYNTPIDATNIGSPFYSVTLNLTSAHYPVTQLIVSFQSFSYTSSNTPPLVSSPQGVPSVTLLSEFGGRENVLKITTPGGFQKLANRVRLQYTIDTSFSEYRRPKYWNTHNWSYGVGFWSENAYTGQEGTTYANWLFNGGGNSDLLIGLTQYPDDGTSPWIGNLPYYNANEWTDARIYKKDIIEGSSLAEGWVNLCDIQHEVPLGNPVGIDPNLTSYESNIYLSDWVWRVCPN